MSIDASVFPLDARRHGAAASHLVFISASLSGKEVRNPERDARRLRFNAAAGIKTRSDVELLIAWHAAMEGQTYGFLITDYLDFKTTKDDRVLYNVGGLTVKTRGRTTPISGAIHQLEKWYTVGSRTFKRKLTRPKSGTLQVYFDDVLKTVTTDYTIDYTTGQLTIVSGSPTVISFNTDFYVPVRFEQNELPLELILYRPDDDTGIGEVPEVGLIEDME